MWKTLQIRSHPLWRAKPMLMLNLAEAEKRLKNTIK